jgi:hypothetical protein
MKRMTRAQKQVKSYWSKQMKELRLGKRKWRKL